MPSIVICGCGSVGGLSGWIRWRGGLCRLGLVSLKVSGLDHAEDATIRARKVCSDLACLHAADTCQTSRCRVLLQGDRRRVASHCPIVIWP